MHIKTLKLMNFRNYGSLNLKLQKNFNIVYGDNAQGKTNILEAVFLCSSGRSHRIAKDQELVKFGERSFFVKVEMERQENSSTIEIAYEKEGKKKIRINGIPAQKMGNLMGQLNSVIFSPEDLGIIKEGPSERRRFIDITLCQLKPSYFFDLQQYAKVLTQRNSLLKEIQKNRSLMDTLDIWNQNLIALGSRIVKVRHEFVERISVYAEKNHKSLTDSKEELRFRYAPSIKSRDFTDISEIQKNFAKALEQVSAKEVILGTTMVGPQRDDYEFFLNGLNIKSFGSQGQQRTVVLSMKLSEIDIMKEDTGEYPIVLLDDVMSELDTSRQEYLFKNLKNVQTIITCTAKEFYNFRELPESSFIHVKNGEVVSKAE